MVHPAEGPSLGVAPFNLDTLILIKLNFIPLEHVDVFELYQRKYLKDLLIIRKTRKQILKI